VCLKAGNGKEKPKRGSERRKGEKTLKLKKRFKKREDLTETMKEPRKTGMGKKEEVDWLRSKKRVRLKEVRPKQKRNRKGCKLTGGTRGIAFTKTPGGACSNGGTYYI